MYIMYNLFSLAAGLVSWGLGIGALCRKGRFGWSFSSLILCILSLVSQLFKINCRVNEGDWAGIEDTFPAVLMAAVVLTSVTLLLNALAFWRRRR